MGVTVAEFFHRTLEEKERKKNEERPEISYPFRTFTNHFMGKTSMNSDNTQEPNPEQLLKLIEAQVAAARERRVAREASQSKAGVVGLFIIVGGAAIALWMLMVLLEQMRPQRGEHGGSAKIEAADRAR